MNEPLSKRNPRVAQWRELARRRSARLVAGRFVVEGLKLVEELLDSDLTVVAVAVDESWSLPDDLMAALASAGIEPIRIAAGGIERIATTASPQPIVAEVVRPEAGWQAAEGADRLLVAVDLNDPGNVGTLARSAVAAGFDGIVALGENADPFGPKALRASAGAMFRVPVVVDLDASAGLSRLASLGLQRIGTRMSDAEPCDEIDLAHRLALVLGSEAHGLAADYDSSIDRWVSVPMAGPVESLNVAMAGTILTYEIGRRRRQAG